ncbi:MAG TPA: hypothetical protein PKJ56_12375 [Promineifilum sp.]|nr:hypothetical protein [Promineifilum sp.]HNS41023.1 hypothetical protein [Promineifilum sp.]
MSFSLHVRHEVTPDRTWAVLQAIGNGESADHVVQSDRQAARLRQLGLLAGQELTPLGEQLLTICLIKPDLWGELGHYLHYTLWDTESEPISGFSWTYQKLVSEAWALGEFDLNAELKEVITTTLINSAEADTRIDVEALSRSAVSLSRDSISGVTVWLKSLVPPVFEDAHFTRRSFCHPELLLLAAGHVGRASEGELGIDMLLTPQRREAICRLCLLEPAALDRVLDWMIPAYPTVVTPGTSSGTYGRFLRFQKWPAFTDLAR